MATNGTLQYDVIIVGAGPAGSTCARACARAGLSTLLLDQEVFPRPKPCGGALSARARSLLDIPLPDDVVDQECQGIRVHYGRHTVERRTDGPIAFMVDRASFDDFLARQAMGAGAVFRHGERVNGIEQTGPSVLLATSQGTYAARWLVGADGSNSAVARHVRAPFGRDEMMSALVGVGGSPATCPRDRLLELYFGLAPLGYGWVFPHRDQCSVGIVGLASEFREVPRHFADHCRAVGIAPEHVRGHTIPLGGIRRRITNGRLLLAGDAAGFADPFHGEGMAYAILSGLLAAEAVIPAVRRGSGDLRGYELACEQRIRKELRIALRMALLIERHPELFVSIFFGATSDLDRYLEIAAGRSDYRSFQRWLIARLPAHLMRHLFRGPEGHE